MSSQKECAMVDKEFADGKTSTARFFHLAKLNRSQSHSLERLRSLDKSCCSQNDKAKPRELEKHVYQACSSKQIEMEFQSEMRRIGSGPCNLSTVNEQEHASSSALPVHQQGDNFASQTCFLHCHPCKLTGKRGVVD
eukprot:244472-Hanusia_phi.AAC.1